MLSLWKSLMLASLIITSILYIADGFKSAMAPARRTFLQMGPLNAVKSLVSEEVNSIFDVKIHACLSIGAY